MIIMTLNIKQYDDNSKNRKKKNPNNNSIIIYVARLLILLYQKLRGNYTSRFGIFIL